jgi:hypothetical protein
MGIEYRITWDDQRTLDLDQLLRHLPGFAAYDLTYASYEYRQAVNTFPMPDVVLKIEAGYLYLCINGTLPEVIVALMTRLTEHGGTMQIALLEG